MAKSRHTAKYERLLTELRAARKRAGVTQVQAAKHFRTHASFVSKVESGERRIDVVELSDFCKIYQIKLVDFLKSAGID
ncbi:helix-turn-helix domain-containing protein [Lacipirellula parvula]|uniref:HTH cro/C1-type domain-containing protein n=1 Tax=Lacipirellula parvula TaxID=2650471 RepID=A0A5K7XL88_9BACT|nr:helix-turn-helix transcriptional regulator [Lacipirellula parvula]BBO35223.1 hypothetical protein PLANPX_4835 [Lacipirellula parvula]